MGYTLSDLNREIVEKIEVYASGTGIDKEELIAEIVAEHAELDGKDIDFALCCIPETVRVHVEKVFQRIKRAEETPNADQGTLPGFEHIQQRYLIEGEDGRRVALNVDRLSAEQIREKCEQLSLMGHGLLAHAEELERYARETGRGW